MGLDEERTWLDFLYGGTDRKPVLPIFLLLGVVGLGLAGAWAVQVARLPWQLHASSPVTTAVGSECDRLAGGTFFIEVEGQRHACSGSDNKCGHEGPIDIAYDPADPASCRAAKNVGVVSTYEWMSLVLALSFVSVGASAASYAGSVRLLRRDLADGQASRQSARARLRRASKWSLGLAAVLVNVAAVLVMMARS